MTKITVDGNTATAKIAYAFSEIASIYPITPSSPMAEYCDEMSAKGVKNLFNSVPRIVEMQSEGGAAGALHGALSAGTLSTTFTASQGLLLMIPNMYKIAGELLPCVMHVSARTLATHALSIFGDHSDVMAVRQTGWAMLCSSNVQECQDLALVSHLATLKSSLPFVHFFDGFRTSHEISTIEDIDLEKIKPYIPYENIANFRQQGLSSSSPHMQGTAQNPDIFFQNREACNIYYKSTPLYVKQCMKMVEEITGRKYGLFDYTGHPKATNIIIAMGSGCNTIEETVNYLNNHGEKVGLIKVRLFRPFDTASLINSLPKSVKRIAVLDRTKEPGSAGEPLYKDIVCALNEHGLSHIKVVGGRYGLGSKEFTPSMVNAIFENLKLKSPKNHFTVGIDDNVTMTSLPIKSYINTHEGLNITNCKFYGYGGDGTVSANKSSIKIIANNANMYGQGYFEYDSKKSGNATICHLRFSNCKINSSYLTESVDFVSVNNQTYLNKYNITKGLKTNGTLLINTEWKAEKLSQLISPQLKKDIVDKKLKVYTINAYDIAKNLGLKNKINLIMQSAFFKLTNIINYEDAKKYMKDFALKNYGKKGQEVVEMNYKAIDSAEKFLKEFTPPANWKKITNTCADCTSCSSCSEYYKNFIDPIQKLRGNELKVSNFSPNGHIPTGTSQYEKRGIANQLPCWNSKNCIECNMCSFVCPHAAIRPKLINPEDLNNKPDTLNTIPATAEPYYQYVMQVSPLDCTGCGLCANVCPSKNKAITMVDSSEIMEKEKQNYNFVEKLPINKSKIFNQFNVKGSQFNKPYFEFSGACAGCGETPYIKVLSQLFGDRTIIANATGCSSIYGGSAPSCPYTKDNNGHGIAWANSLFEDNAEFGLGIKLGTEFQNNHFKQLLNQLKEDNNPILTPLINNYLQESDKNNQRNIGKEIIKFLQEKDTKKPLDLEILSLNNRTIDDNMWIIGGDGWAYDIGFGGLDHVLASGENINILVLDTEVYSNTGGQSSKSTPKGAIAKFASKGKTTNKKDLASMATTYKNVYVAKVALGADMNQFLTALKEADKHEGVSLIIAYAPCIEHGIDMSQSINEQKRAVASGYWHLWRYNPQLQEQGKSPFILDSSQPTLEYNDFLLNENRYKLLLKKDEQLAIKLFNEAKERSLENYNILKKLSEEKF